jgi:hypothetical protein
MMNKNLPHTENISGPAYLASALINNDFSGLTECEENEARAFIAEYGVPVMAGEEFTEWYNGKLTLLVDYLLNGGEA